MNGKTTKFYKYESSSSATVTIPLSLAKALDWSHKDEINIIITSYKGQTGLFMYKREKSKPLFIPVIGFPNEDFHTDISLELKNKLNRRDIMHVMRNKRMENIHMCPIMENEYFLPHATSFQSRINQDASFYRRKKKNSIHNFDEFNESFYEKEFAYEVKVKSKFVDTFSDLKKTIMTILIKNSIIEKNPDIHSIEDSFKIMRGMGILHDDELKKLTAIWRFRDEICLENIQPSPNDYLRKYKIIKSINKKLKNKILR